MQQGRDELKRKLCEENGVILIEIPNEYNYKDEENMEKFIMKKLVEYKFLA